VQTHFTRHWLGVEWFVKTSRSDRTGITRVNKSQDDPVDVEGSANAQALINIARKRLCYLASRETREAFEKLVESLEEIEPELASVLVPECVYRNGLCPEFKSCGYNKTKAFKERLDKYTEPLIEQIYFQNNEDL
jgi:hypothetical protein